MVSLQIVKQGARTAEAAHDFGFVWAQIGVIGEELLELRRQLCRRRHVQCSCQFG
jgi:hypothetical protein